MLSSLERKGLIKSSKTDSGLLWELGRSPKLDAPVPPKPVSTWDHGTKPKPKKSWWPLAPGTPVFPRVKVNSVQFGLQEVVDGKAIILGPARDKDCYLVQFEGETEKLVYGPVKEKELQDEQA